MTFVILGDLVIRIHIESSADFFCGASSVSINCNSRAIILISFAVCFLKISPLLSLLLREIYRKVHHPLST